MSSNMIIDSPEKKTTEALIYRWKQAPGGTRGWSARELALLLSHSLTFFLSSSLTLLLSYSLALFLSSSLALLLSPSLPLFLSS